MSEPQEDTAGQWWRLVGQYPRTCVAAGVAVLGALRLAWELRQDYRYRHRVRVHRRLRRRLLPACRLRHTAAS